MTTQAPALVLGQRVRLTPDGPVCTVVRVTPCAAYVGQPRVKPHPDPVRRAAGETITSTTVDPISLHAAVYQVDGEPGR